MLALLSIARLQKRDLSRSPIFLARMISAPLDQVATACMRSRAISGMLRGALDIGLPTSQEMRFCPGGTMEISRW